MSKKHHEKTVQGREQHMRQDRNFRINPTLGGPGGKKTAREEAGADVARRVEPNHCRNRALTTVWKRDSLKKRRRTFV